jgi:prepilin-type processing-associated H-X9-DG protein
MRNVIQILILVLIGLICGGILTVFIVQVRAAADRAQCTNNLRSLALSMTNYHECYNKFPTAAEANPDLPPEKRLSWIVGIVPFVEANQLYNKMDHKKPWDAEENRFAALINVKYLDCPGHAAPPADTMTPTCYIGVAGIGTDAINLPLEDRRAGFFGYERTFKLEDFKKHAGSIVILAETSQLHGSWTAAGSPTTRGLIPDGSPYIGVGGQFGGNHRNGANAAFMDGSVRFVEQSIDPAVWEAMATLSGKSNWE